MRQFQRSAALVRTQTSSNSVAWSYACPTQSSRRLYSAHGLLSQASLISPSSIISSRTQQPLLPSTLTSLRSLHQSSRLRQQSQPSPNPESTNPQASKPSQESKSAGASGEQQKSTAHEEGQEGAKAESDKSEGAEKEDGKQEEKKEDAAPPPPHGSKTPWQVFTETLNAEFKQSKEWNEGTKALSSGYQEFTQNPNLQRAKSAYTSAAEGVTSTTGKAIKGTAKVVGAGAAWTWDTSVMKGVRAGANVAGRGIDAATKPIRETEAFKSVKEVIDDGSSSRYGGWKDKEERKRLREQREAKEFGPGGRRAAGPAVEDPDAGTNVTLHKDSAWQEKWREFKDTSRVAQSLFNMKAAYHESENPLVSTARSITDRVAGFFAENETAMVIKKFREMDPTFQVEPFLQEMREYILPEVLDAYVKGDVETLKVWLSAAQYSVYAALMQQYTTNGLRSDGKILDIRHVDIVSAKILDPGDIPIFLITCRTQEVHTYKNIKTGQLAAGMDDKVQLVTYVIGVTRIPEDVSNPETRGWRLIELQKSARDYI